MKRTLLMVLCSFWCGTLAYAAEIQLGRCYMEVCTWYKVLKQQEVAADVRGRLIELTLRGGSSPDVEDALKKIKWSKSPHTVYVFCSVYLPSVMIESDGKYQVDVLDFWQGTPGVMETASNIYRETCHPSAVNIDESELAKRFQYRQLNDSAKSISYINKIGDIFGYVK